MPNVGQTIAYTSNILPSSASTPIIYNWSISPSGGGTIIPSANAQHISVQWSQIGTYTLTLQTSNSCSNVGYSEEVVVTAIPTPQPLPVPVPQPIPVPLPVTVYYEMERCNASGIYERSVRNITGLAIGTIVKLSDNLCYTITGTSTNYTTNVILSTYGSCNLCQGISPTPQPLPVPLPVQVPITQYWEFQRCNNSSITERASKVGYEGLSVGSIVKLSDNNCYQLIGSSTVPTSNTITNTYGSCASCTGVPAPQPQPIPIPIPVPVPVQATAWNLLLCSDGSNATIQVADSNLTTGVIIKDDTTGICYTVANLNPVQFTLMGQHSEHQDCASCIGSPPTPQPIPVPVQAPQPIPVPVPPVPVPVPVHMVWNLRLCSNGEIATQQVDDMNLTTGVIIKDDVTGICYTVENLNPAAFTLIGQHSEHQDCASCATIPTPQPVPVPVPIPQPIPVPIPVPVAIPVPTCPCFIFTADNSSGATINYHYTECGTNEPLTGTLTDGGQIQGCLSDPNQFIDDATSQSLQSIAGVTVNNTGVNCC